LKTFIAVEFDDNFKKYLAGVRDVVRGNSIKGNFTHEANFHLTLRYLGDTKAEAIKALQLKLQEICLKYSTSEIKVEKLGAFKRRNRKIIFLEPQIEDSLVQIHSEIEDAVREIGFEADSKAFVPHITLGREINIFTTVEDLNEMITVYNGNVTARSVSLMESTREDGKLVYKRIFSIKLK
jgi:RNA 2',3'-cyclic 3'-phosphodiesterase